jgi:hypothetical protein
MSQSGPQGPLSFLPGSSDELERYGQARGDEEDKLTGVN